MPTKYPQISLALKKILDETHLSLADRSLILKQDPLELARILKANLRANHWKRYYKARPEDLPALLRLDAEDLENNAESALTHESKRKNRLQARNLDVIAEELQRLQSNNHQLTRMLNSTEDTQKRVGREIDSFGQLVMRAARNGLLGHPFISNYVLLQRLTKNYNLLRNAKIKLEAHLPRPIEYRQLVIEELRKKGYSLERISRMLKSSRLNPDGKTLGKKGIHKRLRETRPTPQ